MSPYTLLAGVLRSPGVLPFPSVELGQYTYQYSFLLLLNIVPLMKIIWGTLRAKKDSLSHTMPQLIR